MNITTYTDDKAKEIAELFYQAVHAITPSVYSAEQKAAWASSPIDYAGWSSRLNKTKPFIAIIDNHVAGFIELSAEGYIDCTYTHPNHQGQGVASALYEHLLAQAKISGIKRLSVDASLIAKPFFERRGFSIIKKNEVQRNGVCLVNFSMEKHLTPSTQLELDRRKVTSRGEQR